MRTRICAVALAALAMGACGGGGGGSGGGTPPPSTATITRADAWRFLEQATFGPTEASAERLISLGYGAWIDQQMAAAPTHHLPYVQSQSAPQTQADRLDAWFQASLRGDDQLRQRVAYALSQIWVVSDVGALGQQPQGLAAYYDVLVDDAFGNYRDLMEKVTLTPAMGVYLSMLGNQKQDPARNIFPDENYARELLQLFTIGLVQLNRDGSVRTDANGAPLPTYDQEVIEGFSHVFTGWTFAGSLDFERPRRDFLQPMQAYPAYHDTGAKVLLNGAVLPANQDARVDLEAALDNIFNHPNVGPFVSRQLIQRLVTSNPSAGYIARVASVFDDDGSGRRGNLAAVVRAILLDREAQPVGPSASTGKLKEPLLRLTQLWRAYGAESQTGRYLFRNPQAWFGQAPLRAPSVFNFYSPDYAPPGELANQGLVSPEMQITTEYTTALVNTYLALAVFQWNSAAPNLRPETIVIDFSADLPYASDAAKLVERVADRLMGGAMSDTLRQQAIALVNAAPVANGPTRVAEALHLMVTSPEFAVQR